MATKMVANFRRSLSFPNQPSSIQKPKKTFHVRSASLPCRSHPLISQLQDEINELKSFVVTKQETRSTAWLCNCLIRLKAVHESLDDLMQLPQTRESLSGDIQLVEKLLEDFLKFVDVFGIFQSLVLTLKEEHLAAQVALRRKDDAKMVMYLKGLRKVAKEMERLEETTQCIGKYHVVSASSALFQPGDSDAEITEAIKDVAEVTVVISNALFNGISLSLPLRKSSWVGLSLAGKSNKLRTEEGIQEFLQVGFENLSNLKKKGDEDFKMIVKNMRNIEDCIVGIETGSEKVFRSLINSRVSLLNVLT